ncbi:hypothetical protein K7X08_017466 [Anisodus acutangulus]|uniref:Uncharacterized protein n=1 Tax=Anisodus acutangulus TaxID=402998 RepID=A0A9Q1LTU1_9SOLA|nr:hypothetical protein K7X08_017466 [Anisodus acutangulus]
MEHQLHVHPRFHKYWVDQVSMRNCYAHLNRGYKITSGYCTKMDPKFKLYGFKIHSLKTRIPNTLGPPLTSDLKHHSTT